MLIKMNLQMFAETEKTEKPTPKKRRDVREEGQVLQSKEVTVTFILIIAFIGLRIFGKHMVMLFMDFMIKLYSTIGNIDSFYNENNLINEALKIVGVFIIIIAPIIVISLIAGLGINYLQVGFLFTTKTLKFDLNRINPVEGFKRLFSKKALMELVKSLLKVGLLAYITYTFIKRNIYILVNLQEADFNTMIVEFFLLIFSFIIRILAVLAFLSFLDYLFQWREHEKRIMMTKQEIKEEYKQTEGDPLIKSKIREKQRRIAMSRMIQEVPKADVIITNPNHIAIALKYNQDLDQAPYVLAKGADIIAENIKKVAIENSIPLMENKPLARVLFDTVEIGDFIPEELYEAVAEVLAYVYSIKDNY